MARGHWTRQSPCCPGLCLGSGLTGQQLTADAPESRADLFVSVLGGACVALEGPVDSRDFGGAFSVQRDRIRAPSDLQPLGPVRSAQI